MIEESASMDSVKEYLSLFLRSIPLKIIDQVACLLNPYKLVHERTWKMLSDQRRLCIDQLLELKDKIWLKHPAHVRDNNAFIAMEHSINSKLIELLKLKLKYNQSTGLPLNDPETEECISSWVTDMMKDKTSLWFDSIRYAEIRNDYNHVKSSYISYTEDRTLAQYNQEDTSPRKFSENSDNKSNDGLLRKNSDVSQYTDHSNMTLKTENLVKTSNLNHEPTPMFKVLSEISETPSMASFHPQKSQFQRKRGETQHLVKKIRQPNGEETEVKLL